MFQMANLVRISKRQTNELESRITRVDILRDLRLRCHWLLYWKCFRLEYEDMSTGE